VRHHPAPFDNLTPAGAGDFAKLDANFLHRASVGSPGLCPLKNEEPAVRVALLDQLCQMYRLTTATNGDPEPAGGPPAYYGLLLADGDHLGRLIRTKGGDRVGRALATFTARLPEIVRRRDGVTIYAGGDDVLAMLAVPGALACADDLATCYADACHPELGAEATLSAAVLFAHVRYPLGAALREARRMLDVVAKRLNGRGSIAAGILQPGGAHCQWVTTWERRLPGEASVRAVELISRLASRPGHDRAEPALSSALLHRLRDSLTSLCDEPTWKPGAWATLPGGFDVRAYLCAEIAHSLEGRATAEVDVAASDLADVVWRLLGRSPGPDQAPGDAGVVDVTKICVDALLLARFVANGGRVERQA
jgi:CRISPR-associated protein Cmr2